MTLASEFRSTAGSKPARLETAALCVGNAVGFAGSSAMPLWIAATIKSGQMSTATVGWLASGELLMLATSVFAVAALGKQVRPRRAALLASGLIVLSNAVAAVGPLAGVVIGRLLSGIGMGALLSAVTRLAAQRTDAQRVLALMQAAMVVLVSVLFLISPALIGRFGPAGVFALLTMAGALAWVAVTALPDEAAADPAITRAKTARRLVPAVACLALSLVFVGQNSVWNYIVLIGNDLGIHGHAMGVVLAFVPPCAMVGPLTAHALGERAGLVWPLLAGLVLLGGDAFLVVAAHSPIAFCASAAMLNAAILFCVPYAIALVGRLDASGRFAAAAPAFMMLAASISPALGAKILALAGFTSLAYVTGVCLALSIALFLAAAVAGGLSPLI